MFSGNEKDRQRKKTSIATKASMWFVLCSFVQKGISFLTMPIFTRLLSTEDYGLVSVYNSWNTIVLIFATLQLASGVFNNGMLKYPDDKDRYTLSMQALESLVTIALFTGYLLTSKTVQAISGLSHGIICGMFLQIFFTSSINLWTARQRYDFHYKPMVAVTLLLAATNPVLGLAFVFLTNGNEGEARIWGSIVAGTAIGLALYIYNFIQGKKIEVKYWKFALRFNLPLIPHYLSRTVLNQSDRIMINNLCGSSYAGIYNVAYNLSFVPNVITNSLNQSIVPWSYRKMKEKKYSDVNNTAKKALVIVAIFVVILILCGPEVLYVAASAKYAEAKWVIPPVTVSVFFMFVYGLFGNVEFFFEESKYVTYASVGGGIANLLLNAIVLPRWGYIAAGYTTLVCYMLFCIMHYIFYNIVLKKHNTEAIYETKFIVLMSTIMLAVIPITLVGYTFNILRYGMIAIGALIMFIYRKKLVQLVVGLMRE